MIDAPESVATSPAAPKRGFWGRKSWPRLSLLSLPAARLSPEISPRWAEGGSGGAVLPQKSCQGSSRGGKSLRTTITPLFLRDPRGSPKSPFAEIALNVSLAPAVSRDSPRVWPGSVHHTVARRVLDLGIQPGTCAPRSEPLAEMITTATFICA